MTTRADPDLHLIADGHRVDPAEAVPGRHMFRLAVPFHTLRLVSRSAVPSAIGDGVDGRRLGYMLGAVSIGRRGENVSLRLDSPELFDGVHPFEAGLGRWTDGYAALPPGLLGAGGEPVTVTVSGFGLPDYGGSEAADRDVELFRSFASLGARCDFGFAQRHFGVASPGLLSWAGTTAAKVLHGLEMRFAGLGDPTMAKLHWRDDRSDYVLDDPRYLSSHVFKGTRCDDAAAEQELKLGVCAGWRLLRRKLLEDIARAELIFVFAAAGSDADPGMLRRLAAALRGIGPATLLGVVEGGEPGRVTKAGDGLLLGQIDALCGESGPFDQWRAVCAAARALSPPASRRSGTRDFPPGR